MKAWFFEDVEEVGNEWRMFFGDPMEDGPGGMNAKKMTQVDFRFIDMLAVEQSIEQCFTGRASMRISLPGEMPGGAMIDYSVKDARTYRIMARVYHSHPLPESGAGAVLRVWDHGDTWVESAAGSKVGRWETLQVTVIGTRKYRIRIHIQCLEDYTGFVYVDQVEVHFAGRDRLGRLADELEAITQQPRINVGSVLHVRWPRRVGARAVISSLYTVYMSRARPPPPISLRPAGERLPRSQPADTSVFQATLRAVRPPALGWRVIARTEPFPKEKVDPKADPMNPIWDDAATTRARCRLGAHLTVEVQDMAHKARPARRASVTPAPMRRRTRAGGS